MKKITLSQEALEKVIQLKQETNASWLRIQREAGVPRHIAKREYEQWHTRQSVDELKAVRIKVAEKDFEQHRHYLCKLADSLVNHLIVPSTPTITKNSKQYLEKLWEKNIMDDTPQDAVTTEIDERRTSRIKRQNGLLFKSLQEHTRGKVDWAVLDQWTEARDRCWQNLEVLGTKVGEVLNNILSQDTALLPKIDRSSKETQAFVLMVEGIIHVIWWNILSMKSTEVRRKLQTTTAGDPTSRVYVVEFNKKPVLTLSDKDLATTVKDKCNWAIDNLYKGHERESAEALLDITQQMVKIFEYLEGLLDPLVLRPLILNTHCELCPLW